MDKLCRLQRIILYQHSKTLLHFLFGLIKTLGCKSVSTETPTQVLGIYLDAFYFPLAKNVWMHRNRWRWTHCLWFYCRYEAKGTQETDSQWSSEKFQIYVFFSVAKTTRGNKAGQVFSPSAFLSFALPAIEASRKQRTCRSSRVTAKRAFSRVAFCFISLDMNPNKVRQ